MAGNPERGKNCRHGQRHASFKANNFETKEEMSVLHIAETELNGYKSKDFREKVNK